MADVTGADADALTPTASGDLVAQLNAAARRQWWPWALGASVFLFLLTAHVWWLAFLVLLVCGFGTYQVFRLERLHHRVDVTYEVQGPIAEWFAALSSAWPALAGLGGAWRITTKGALQTVYQHKVNAGASYLVTRTAANFRTNAPKILVTNVQVPSITSGIDSLYFLPDRLLIRSGRRWSDVDYADVQIAIQSQNFIEDGRVPRDAQQVSTTWQYANVKGGPDRRYKNNRQLPVMQYGRLTVSSRHGLQWVLDLSKMDLAEWVARAIKRRPATVDG